MNKVALLIILLCIKLIPTVALAEIYSCEDANGKVTFQQTSCKESPQATSEKIITTNTSGQYSCINYRGMKMSLNTPCNEMGMIFDLKKTFDGRLSYELYKLSISEQYHHIWSNSKRLQNYLPSKIFDKRIIKTKEENSIADFCRSSKTSSYNFAQEITSYSLIMGKKSTQEILANFQKRFKNEYPESQITFSLKELSPLLVQYYKYLYGESFNFRLSDTLSSLYIDADLYFNEEDIESPLIKSIKSQLLNKGVFLFNKTPKFVSYKRTCTNSLSNTIDAMNNILESEKLDTFYSDVKSHGGISDAISNKWKPMSEYSYVELYNFGVNINSDFIIHRQLPNKEQCINHLKTEVPKQEYPWVTNHQKAIFMKGCRVPLNLQANISDIEAFESGAKVSMFLIKNKMLPTQDNCTQALEHLLKVIGMSNIRSDAASSYYLSCDIENTISLESKKRLSNKSVSAYVAEERRLARARWNREYEAKRFQRDGATIGQQLNGANSKRNCAAAITLDEMEKGTTYSKLDKRTFIDACSQ